ncbi:MAG: sugar O-acetyltransferase [Oscillospiraceae bacterium]|nr:sugar O-acetyltransferase [Oscillospiraceae bacterium]
MTEREKIHSGDVYFPNGEEILSEQLTYLDLMDEYNRTSRLQSEKRKELLKKLFAEVGEGTYVESPYFGNWGGHHVHLGKNVYINAGLKLVDDTHIYIGDYTMLGPNVVLATAGHPIDPTLREKALQYNLPVRIGRNCWLGAGVIVMPGVTIGENSVIGAGSVVTRDIPANVVAVGNPCRVMREIGEHDREYYWRDRKIDQSLFERDWESAF